uniref:Carotenoid oxygenase n=1 Tax=Pseudo-nitzschia australis TaxID=44445 RepID=A0A7S4ER81_9STRA|mmetsp:Transcript_19225/g.41780  ORF Transcript_19225/g.41780 Transcript_19225/m.41780 type:complete len:651 (-) Transcript_19225:187-2139(-)
MSLFFEKTRTYSYRNEHTKVAALTTLLGILLGTTSFAFSVLPISDRYLSSSLRSQYHRHESTTKIRSTNENVDMDMGIGINTANSGVTFVKEDDSVPLSASSFSTPEERAQKAKETWSTTALQPTPNTHQIISLSDDDVVVHNSKLFDEFKSVKGTYYINGLANCQIGSRLIHPFEAHGYCKSLVFDGNGDITYTSKIIETPLTTKELGEDRIVNRGVMSTVADIGTAWGMLQSAFSSRERDTANLVADLWPLPHDHKGSNEVDGAIDPVLIVCTDNGEPYALDPKTLEMKGRLSEYIPKLSAVLPPGIKCLAHTRYDEDRNTFIMCLNEMVVPGENFMGNSTFTFLEFDEKFDIVSKKEYTTRFMVCHDWVITPNYYVIPKNPAYLKWDNIMKFTLGQTVGTSVFAMEEETNGEFILIPRHNSEEPVREVESDAFFNCFHFGPAYEKKVLKEHELVIHGCVFDSYTFGGEMGFVDDGRVQGFDPVAWGSDSKAPPPRLDRFVIDLKTFQMKKKERVPVIPVDMPTFDGDAKVLRYSYFLGASRPEGWFPFRQVVKLDLETFKSIVWDAGDGQVVSEPMFIPRNNPTGSLEEVPEDDGFVISIVHNSERKTAKLVVWDSLAFREGPIAECPLGDLIPWCVHGSFYPDYNP